MSAAELVAAIERHTGRQGRRNGRNTRLLCPAHDDHHPSLDVAEGADGQAILVCRSHGCTYTQVLEALGLDPTANGDDPDWTPNGRALAYYSYIDEGRRLLYQVCRTGSKDFPLRRPDPTSKTGWRWKLGDTRKVLYRLPRVLEAVARGETIYVVEGEKDVGALERLGLTATCNPGGAGNWADAYAGALAGATVVVIADRDEPGYRHARRVARSLEAAGVHVELKQPRPDHAGADVSDHLAAGHTVEELEPLDIGVDEDAVVFEPLRAFLERQLPPAESLVGVARGGTNLLPRYGWMLIWGREGSAKTSVLVDGLYHFAAGEPWLDYPVERPMRVVVVINEGVPGGLQDKLAHRLELWHGDRELVLDNLAIYASPWGRFTFRNDTMVEHARRFVASFEADYVALDPLHTLGTLGAGSPQDTEAFKRDLMAFGLWESIGIITAHHSNKMGMVSGDWARHADTVIHLEKDGKNPATKLTLEKARPADPAELGNPFLLEWDVETFSYRRKSLETTGPRTSDAELLAEVERELEGRHGTPVGMTDLLAAVGHDANRVRRLVKSALEAGDTRIRNLASTASNTYLLVVDGQKTIDGIDALEAEAQTRMATGRASDETQSSTISPLERESSSMDPRTPEGSIDENIDNTTTGESLDTLDEDDPWT